MNSRKPVSELNARFELRQGNSLTHCFEVVITHVVLRSCQLLMLQKSAKKGTRYNATVSEKKIQDMMSDANLYFLRKHTELER